MRFGLYARLDSHGASPGFFCAIRCRIKLVVSYVMQDNKLNSDCDTAR